MGTCFQEAITGTSFNKEIRQRGEELLWNPELTEKTGTVHCFQLTSLAMTNT